LAALQASYQDGSWGKYWGENVTRLEEKLRQYFHADHALACGSGTFAVELALRALKIGPGDEVLAAGYDYPGNFLSIHAVGAFPVLIDLAPENWNLHFENIIPAIGPKTRALLVSHLHGGFVSMKEVMEIARTHHLAVIEDAAQMPGAVIQGQKAGTWGDVGILSFGGSKLLTAGRGGALITNRPEIFQRAKTFQLRGNLVCPLSELQAAVLLPQIDQLDVRNRCRTQQVVKLCEKLEDQPGLKPFYQPCQDSEPGFYKLGFQWDAEEFGITREVFVQAIRAEGIAMDEGFSAAQVGRSPNRFRAGGKLAQAERAHHGTVILHHPVLLGNDEDLQEIVEAIKKVRRFRQQLQK
jgi:dTDP-4-amino-4,6-dideoxygalactose transaminase